MPQAIFTSDLQRRSFDSDPDKEKSSGRFQSSFLGSGGRTRTCDLVVMSHTSCHCSTPRYMDKENFVEVISYQTEVGLSICWEIIYRFTFLSSWAFEATIIVDNDISIAPTAGDSKIPLPKSTPAARGMASTL